MSLQIGLRFGYAVILVFAWVSVMSIAGCGKSRIERYDVSGTVTYAGKPIPAGQVLFQPDSKRGNRGPATIVQFKDGHYDTAQSGKGTIGGPHIAIITARFGPTDLPPESPSSGQQDRIPDVRIPIDLPKETSVQNLEVPRSH